ncbi:mitochondrial import inner membrane translocase subunit TIM44 [Plasmodium gonderi]|uniref:Mitochondrial import inner membrane translocase subunit TIM44 n=1 Tax=Plasmodium gonderi TaxID=77519 RepID=A0A1Y1JKT0_PLAGO|nr:mitochondrial import inner membrane translocase subunit TIM44 [Plasmodium gonderi]GAW81023.1 mitochondrial import inner membrane translocase subunit TIM44 [Plasmodium gonderi]
MRGILNNVLIVNHNIGKNFKCRRFVSGKYESKHSFNNHYYVLKNSEQSLWRHRNIHGCVNPTVNSKRCFSTFMKNVIEQVKKDMKENKQYQEALKELKEKTEIDHKAVKLKKNIEEKIIFLKSLKEKNEEAVKLLYNDMNKCIKYMFENYRILKFCKYTSVQFFLTLQKLLFYTSSKLTELCDKWNDKNSAFVQLDKWRQEMAIKRYKKNNARVKKQKRMGVHDMDQNNVDEEDKEFPNEFNTETLNEKKNESKSEEECYEQKTGGNKKETSGELVLAHESAWDKFGSKLKDMPFLNNFFENPILGKLFGETELAAALREMKIQDKNFKLSELMYLFECVISKHIVESYLIGDEETLRLHCGSSAFNSLNASINERKKKKVYLDTNVLIYKNHELKGAQRMEESSPWFIFTFHTQQINCLKNINEEIIEGNIDDIREVVYTIALSKHPEPETEGLLYPYIIREFAIIGNTPSW